MEETLPVQQIEQVKEIGMSFGLMEILMTSAIIFIALLTIGLIFARLYSRASKEISFVRTGFGGQQVIMNGGALVFPVLHETIPVNMNTLRLEVRRANEQALITKDRMRVDVQAEFYVRVQPTIESIANAAQTLGKRTMQPDHLKELVEGKFVDALRAVAAEMAMEELHEQRVSFVQKVQAAVSEDILKNGLELESVSLTGLDQTNKEYFNPDNAFDAEGLTKLTQEIEERRKKRNDIEQETEVLIRRKNLEAEQQKLEIARDEEYAMIEQSREIAIRRAEQIAQIAQEEAEREREAEQAKIQSQQKVKESAIIADQSVQEREIEKQRIILEQEVNKERSVESANVEKKKLIELAEQAKDIAIAEKSREKSEADALADQARAIAAKAAEEVATARQTEIAERDMEIELIEARKEAQQKAITITVAAEADKQASVDKAEAIRIAAESEAEAERIRAAAQKEVYEVEANGRQSLNEAANTLSVEQIALQVKMELIQKLPEIIAQSVKPIENIDGIKILQVDGLNGPAGVGSQGSDDSVSKGGAGLPDQAINAALRYRTQAPLLDALMGELGIQGGSLEDMVGSLSKDNGLLNTKVANGSDKAG